MITEAPKFGRKRSVLNVVKGDKRVRNVRRSTAVAPKYRVGKSATCRVTLAPCQQPLVSVGKIAGVTN